MSAPSELLFTMGGVPLNTPASGKTDLYIGQSSHPKARPAILDDVAANFSIIGGEATAQSTPTDPSGTTNTTGLMMGLASGSSNAASITNSFTTGRMLVIITGWIASNTSGDGAKVRARYGALPAPANGDALTGTTLGTLVNFTAAANNQKMPFSCIGIVTGLTRGTSVWLDLGLAAVTGGTATVGGISISALEI